MSKFILAIDQGTTSSRAIVFDHAGKMAGVAQEEFKQIFPEPGWVEHNAMEIWTSQLEVLKGALSNAGVQASELVALITPLAGKQAFPSVMQSSGRIVELLLFAMSLNPVDSKP